MGGCLHGVTDDVISGGLFFFKMAPTRKKTQFFEDVKLCCHSKLLITVEKTVKNNYPDLGNLNTKQVRRMLKNLKS